MRSTRAFSEVNHQQGKAAALKPGSIPFFTWMLCAAAVALGIPGNDEAQAQPAIEAWVQRHNSPSDNVATARGLVVDASGNVIVLGEGENDTIGQSWLLIKLSSDGVPLWTNRYSGSRNLGATPTALAVDASGKVFVTGYDDTDYATIAYSSAGVPLWTNGYNGPANGADQAHAVAVDGSGNVFVTGFSRGSNGPDDDDYATIAYSSTGVPLWTNRYNGPANDDIDLATEVAVDGSGNVFVTGYSIGIGGGPDYATIAYSNAGVPLWTNRYSGPGFGGDYPRALAVDSSGTVFVTGHSYAIGTAYDFVTLAYLNAGVPLWTNRYSGLGSASDQAYAMALDGNGNVIVTGSSQGSNYVTVKYSGAGMSMWTNRYSKSGTGENQPRAVVADSTGRVFVTGRSYDSTTELDYATIAYSSAGLALWTNRYNGSGNGKDHAVAVAVDHGGRVFVTGTSDGPPSYDNIVTLGYSTSTGALLWTNRHIGQANGFDYATAVAVDTNGNVFVTGYSYASGSSLNYATVGYSSGGVPLWINGYSGPGTGADRATSLAVDNSGNVIVTGHSRGGSGNEDYATIKYTGAGVPLWTNRYNAPVNAQSAWAHAIAVDESGNVFVTGLSQVGGVDGWATVAYSSEGGFLWANRYNGPGNTGADAKAVAADRNHKICVVGYAYGNGSGEDYTTIAYSTTGAPLWTNRYDGPARRSDRAAAVAVDGSGNVIVTGDSLGSNNSADYATIKYSEAGVGLWTNRYNGPANGADQANAVAVDSSGNVFVTGRSTGVGSRYDYATIAYSNTGVPLWTNRYNGPGNTNDVAKAVMVDRNGNVIVTGSSIGFASSEDYVTIAYSNAGTPLWTNRYNGPANGSDSPEGNRSLAVNPDGSVYVAGSSDGIYSADTAYDFVTIKYAISPPPPELVIQQVTLDAIRICWPTNAPNYVLEFKDQFSTNVFWTPVNAPFGIEGGNFCVTNQTEVSSARFYRLRFGP